MEATKKIFFVLHEHPTEAGGFVECLKSHSFIKARDMAIYCEEMGLRAVIAKFQNGIWYLASLKSLYEPYSA